MNEYLEWLAVQNYTPATIVTFRVSIDYFLQWCRERGLDDVIEITRPVLERYQRSLYHYRKRNGAADGSLRNMLLRLSKSTCWWWTTGR